MAGQSDQQVNSGGAENRFIRARLSVELLFALISRKTALRGGGSNKHHNANNGQRRAMKIEPMEALRHE
jgi:hypothetical protein